MTNSLSYDRTREDITLVVRNFNFPMPNAIRTPTVSFNPLVATSLISTTPQSTLTNSTSLFNSEQSNTNTNNYDNTNSSSSSEPALPFPDPDEKIKAYVNFKDFYKNVEIAKKNGTLPHGLLL